MNLTQKLQIKPGQSIALVNSPKSLKLDLPDISQGESPAKADSVLVFVTDKKELASRRSALIEAAQRDALAWVAYPKAGRLGTDLNRDILWKELEGEGIRPVRQVAIDETWSALRFRPA